MSWLSTSNRNSRVRQAAKTSVKRLVLAAAGGLNHFVGRVDRRPVAILMYHRLVDPIPGIAAPTWNVPPAAFRAQMTGLLERGFQPCSLRRLIEERGQWRTMPPKSFVVTFDDGHESVYRHAWPILKELKIPATLFLPTAYLDSEHPFPFDDWPAAGSSQAPGEAWRPMTTRQCLAMAEDGLMELGAHTHTHQDFTIRPGDFEPDLALNLEFLRSKLNIHQPPFAFPFGFVTPLMLSSVRRSGMTCGLTTEVALVDPTQSPFGWGRIQVEPWDTPSTLASKLNGWYSWLPALRRRVAGRHLPPQRTWEPAI
jgi:peptidoglycan/xylan/chitin deacetylase (PgdA/CDA1 family)